jgi:hypothetical protein
MLGAVILQALVAQFAVVAAVFDEVENRLDPTADLAHEMCNPLQHLLVWPLG